MPDPLDLARCRALAEEAGRGLTLAALQAVAGGADRSFEMATLAQNTVREYHALTTALRAACDGVERLRERIAGAEAGIIGKVTARMGWIDMTTAEELIAYLEERDAIRRRALAARGE